MKPVAAPSGTVCHVLTTGGALDAGGTISHVGGDIATPQSGDRITWFATLRERDERADVQAYQLRQVALRLLAELEAIRPDENYAYAVAYDEARRWLELHPSEDNAVASEADWPLLEIRVRACGCTAFEAATDILQTARATTIAQEQKRIERQEYARSLDPGA